MHRQRCSQRHPTRVTRERRGREKTKIQVCFITEGKQLELRGKIIKGGYTIWKMKNGSPVAIHFDSMEKAIEECIK